LVSELSADIVTLPSQHQSELVGILENSLIKYLETCQAKYQSVVLPSTDTIVTSNSSNNNNSGTETGQRLHQNFALQNYLKKDPLWVALKSVSASQYQHLQSHQYSALSPTSSAPTATTPLPLATVASDDYAVCSVPLSGKDHSNYSKS
jgi:hypothetical protein